MNPPMSRSFGVPSEFLLLHQYLDGRFADGVVLTFAEIEDLLGTPLPPAARTDAAWWANVETAGVASPQTRSWTRAHRTAKVNLGAQIVVFDRTPD